jgi:hypothetical protein
MIRDHVPASLEVPRDEIRGFPVSSGRISPRLDSLVEGCCKWEGIEVGGRDVVPGSVLWVARAVLAFEGGVERGPVCWRDADMRVRWRGILRGGVQPGEWGGWLSACIIIVIVIRER